MNKRNKIIVAIVAIVGVLAVAIGGYFLARNEAPEAAKDPAAASSTAGGGQSLAPGESPSSFSSECSTTNAGFVPVRYTIEGSLEVDEKVFSLNVEADNSIAAPPPAEKRAASWWNAGPKPGQPGKTVLSIHTYRQGGALGNELYADGASQLKAGDMIKLYGENGEVACYEFSEAKRIMVDDYVPESDTMIDYDGDSEVAIIICWDFDKNAKEDEGEDPWKSRVFFYGKFV